MMLLKVLDQALYTAQTLNLPCRVETNLGNITVRPDGTLTVSEGLVLELGIPFAIAIEGDVCHLFRKASYGKDGPNSQPETFITTDEFLNPLPNNA